MAKKSEEIKTVPFLTYIPVNTVELEITAKIYKNGEIIEAKTSINSMDEIRNGMVSGKDLDEENQVYELTEKAKKELGLA